MIALVQGTLLEKSEGEIVIMTAGGIGCQLLCSMTTLAALPVAGQDCRLFTYLNVREDALELYGFLSREERELFKRLISVSGIGPKSALFVLGSMPIADLRLAILTGDSNALCRAPGIGKKTAQRISLELKDKLTKDALASGLPMDELSFAEGESPATDALGEAMQALKSLGYSPQEAASALKGIKADTADEIIKLALRRMAQQG
ncbi:MAG: Holliday junction branch migration protein RuvA [Clostridia bacterium]